MHLKDGGSSTVAVIGRLFVAVVGGYAFSSAIATLFAVTLPMTVGMSRIDATLAASMPAFLVYLAVVIWSFADRRLVRLYVLLFGASALMFLAAFCLMHWI